MLTLPLCENAEQAVSGIRSGDRVFIHTAAAAPQRLVDAMAARAGELSDVGIYHLHTEGDAPYMQPGMEEHLGIRLSPCVRGMFALIWAITRSAISTAALVASTETPSEQNPCLSGGDTWIRATSSGRMRRRNMMGTSLRKQGMNSARPWFIGEFLLILLENKKWWLLPILAILLLASLLAMLGGSGAAPFIYTLF